MKSKHGEVALKNAPGRPKDAAKREGIVRAATALFLKDGYQLTSMEAVAKKADVSKLTIYSHFTDKDALFREVIRQRCDSLAAPECFLAMAQMPVEEALLQLGNNLATLIYRTDSVRLTRIMMSEAAHHPKVIRIFYEAGPQRVKESFTALLSAWHEQGQLSIPYIPRAVEQFFSLLKGERMMKTLLMLMPEPDAREIRELVQSAVAFFLSAYGPQPKQRRSAP